MLLFVDGDVICHAAADSIWYARLKKLGMAYDGFSFVEYDKEGKRIPLPPLTPKEESEYLEKSYDAFSNIINKLKEECYAEDAFIAVKGADNFRYNVFPDYKKSRQGKSANEVVSILRQMLLTTGEAIPAYGREADDLLRIWATQAAASGDPFAVVSIDKDLRCIPGKHVVVKKDKSKGFSYEIVDVGVEDALRLYYTQLLTGDPVDSIPGIPNIGPKKAEKILKDCKSEIEFQEAVVMTYFDFYAEDWLHYLNFNGKLIHIQRHSEDYFRPSEWSIVRELM